MTFNKTVFALALTTLTSTSVFAQSNTASDLQRDVNQQQRIEQGLQSGQLNTHEASQLEHEQAHVDHLEQKAERNGSISAKEQQRIDAAQDHAGHQIAQDRHNDVHGNPDSKSSQHLQADVRHDIGQQQRIESGVQSGELSHREVGRLEKGEARDARSQSLAAANGHVTASEQQHLRNQQSRESTQIHKQKHDGNDRS